MPEPTPLYGRQPRAVLAGYAPFPYACHAKDYARATAGRGPWYDELLVEEHDDGTVTILPPDAMPYAWRDIWRRVRT